MEFDFLQCTYVWCGHKLWCGVAKLGFKEAMWGAVLQIGGCDV